MRSSWKNDLVFIPLAALTLTIIANAVFVTALTEPVKDWKLFIALVHGIICDLFFPLLFAGCANALAYKYLLAEKIAGFVIILLCLLPITDMVYFKATYERFNWSVWHDLNWYALKATLLSSETYVLCFICILSVIGVLLVNFYRALKSPSQTSNLPLKNYVGHLIVMVVLLKLFFPVELYQFDIEYYQIDSNFAPHKYREIGQNNLLKTLAAGSFKGFLTFSVHGHSAFNSYASYSQSELEFLKKKGLLPPPADASQSGQAHFNRVIILVFEAIAFEYLHHYNPAIPKEATDFFDQLAAQYPASKNFYTSASPTINGLYALLNSRIPFLPKLASFRHEKSLASLFKEKYAGRSYFIRGVSKHYSNEHQIIKSVLGFDELIAYEELQEFYPDPPITSWGFHDDIVLDHTLKILATEKNKPVFIVASLIDQHQPPHYCGIPRELLPKAIAAHPSPIVASLFWANHVLKNFVTKATQAGLLDPHTLLVITSDHYPFPGFGHQELIKDVEYDPLGKIPLIFESNSSESCALINSNKMSCQLDLAPTICQLTGFAESESFIGRSMLKPSAVSRKIGFYNNVLSWDNGENSSKIDLAAEQIDNSALQKWINNLFAGQFQ